VSSTADVAIIGAGIMGISTAYHLARRGFGRIVVLDLGDVGSGSSNVEMQRGLGLDVALLAPDEVARRFPYLQTADLIGATYCSEDGYSDPRLCVRAMADRARQLGVEVRTGQKVGGIARQGERVTGVETTDGPLEAPAVLIAAGPWCGEVGKLAGVEIPVVPRRRDVFALDDVPLETLPDTPYILDPHAGVTLHREGEIVEFGCTLPLAPTYDVEPNPGAGPGVFERVVHRAPVLAGRPITRATAGLLEVTPDHNGIISGVAEVPGLYVLGGFSGHGFMHAPIAGQLMAELIADGHAQTVDVSSFELGRFARGETAVDATSPFH
jgi:sarcosine oxidase subunit beta